MRNDENVQKDVDIISRSSSKTVRSMNTSETVTRPFLLMAMPHRGNRAGTQIWGWTLFNHFHDFTTITGTSLLVERLGVGGGGGDVGIAGSLVGAGLLLEGLGGSKVGSTSLLVGRLVVTSGLDEVSDGGSVVEEGEHCVAW